MTLTSTPRLVLESLEALGTPAAARAREVAAVLREMEGYAAMFKRMEDHPEEAPAGARVRLAEFAAVQLVLMRRPA